MASGDLVRRMYTDFRGVDFREGEVDLRRSPDSVNMWKDYRKPDGIRKRPSLVQFAKYSDNSGDGKIKSIDFFRRKNDNGETTASDLIVLSGTNLYGGDETSKKILKSNFNHEKCKTFIFSGVLYIKTNRGYYQYDGAEVKEVSDENGNVYIPTTSIRRKPKGGGTTYEDVNILTRKRKNTFVGDGESRVFYVDTDKMNIGAEVIVTVDGERVELQSEPGQAVYEDCVYLKEAPPAPETDGQDNVCIEFTVQGDPATNTINSCHLATVFDNRVFFSGSPRFPNKVWHSTLDNPTYISDLDYYIEGQDDVPVKAMVAGNDELWVFKEPSPEKNSIFSHKPSVDSEYGKVYPSAHSNISIGCVAAAINFNDDIVFFSDRGMEGIAGEVTAERVLAHRSSLVDAKLLSEENYKNMILEEWEGYLLVIIDNKVYLADSRTMCQVEEHYEYEWFYWELDYKVTCTRVHEGVLYIGTEDGAIWTLNGDGKNTGRRISAHWTTPLDEFNHPQFLKTTNKRGCVIEGEDSIGVYVKTDNSEWQSVSYARGLADYGICRIKRKKFKGIQLKFAGNPRSPGFALKSATLECYVGGYIKR